MAVTEKPFKIRLRNNTVQTINNVTLTKGSHVRIPFICNCGNVVETSYRIGINRKDCGECWKKELIVDHKIRMLTLLEDVSKVNKSHKALWRCDCGIEKRISIKSILNGLTSSCGCKQIKPGVGNCDKRKSEKINITKFNTNGIIILDDKSLYSNDDDLINCKCKCGKEFKRKWNSIYFGNNKSCGKCSYIKKSDIINKKYGNLKVIHTTLEEYGPYSEEYVNCECSCGLTSKHRFKFLHLGQTKSCGKCAQIMDEWWKYKPPIAINGTISQENKYNINYLEEYFTGSKLRPLYSVSTTTEPIKFECLFCKSIFTTQLSWLYHNKTKSCGCLTNNTSRLSSIIKNWFETSELEFSIGKYSYDIKIGNFLIECHGLRYHSTELRDSRKIDIKKRLTAINNGYDYLMFYEDELIKHPEKVKSFLENKFNTHSKIKLRPQQLTFKEVTKKETSDFLNTYHYIGSVSAKRYFASYYNNELIGVMLFSKPTRQNIHGIELTRYCVNNNYKVYGLGSWMLKKTLELGIDLPIVSYSDNRLHSGGLYQKLGFVEVGQVRQDYYWVKNNKRFHKSSLRKPKSCEITETELRESENYHKIWDLGKTKWVLNKN